MKPVAKSGIGANPYNFRASVAALALVLFACGQPVTQLPSSASATVPVSESAAPSPTEETAGVARWIDQRGANMMGVSIPEGQLTLVAGRRVLVGKDGHRRRTLENPESANAVAGARIDGELSRGSILRMDKDGRALARFLLDRHAVPLRGEHRHGEEKHAPRVDR